jgi:hypothetical protein
VEWRMERYKIGAKADMRAAKMPIVPVEAWLEDIDDGFRRWT